jgi:D-glycero-D-manno-heptose 1,7-bisphosphate phosphatase
VKATVGHSPRFAPVMEASNSTKDTKRLVLLDRDGVIIVNRRTNIKRPRDIELLPFAAEAIARLNKAGCRVAICTNQPEIARGAMSRDELDQVHRALQEMLAAEGAHLEMIFCCTKSSKNPWLKPSCGRLKDALRHYAASAADTPFVGDQADDLKAAFHAGCPRILVKTGLGRKALEEGIPQYVDPVLIVENIAEAADAILKGMKVRGDLSMEPRTSLVA